MPLFETNPKNQETANQQTSTTTPPSPESKSGLLTILGQCLPFAPLVFEQFTGQKVPQLSGTMADIQAVLTQLQLTQTQILTQQQQLTQRLMALENSAVQQLTSLTQQFQSLRLTHTREKKEIEYHPNPKLENQES